ncbi:MULTISPECIES: PRTRC system protein C [unclassified Burkholderia]|uniref:PRTRC system protein C n=1 Tax=Burkholderia TaxID=32008 RepID=UPI00141E0945|nr:MULTISPECIES: PRTRC system protein C [unclassified Burkholderia]NIE81883.1 PRTRC system protein C [Burkholderia sp. Tr-860]NIF61153.1 PRTRC system protein C [Burkholderia sp. Cy-647]NIF93974.1 PRTRC system protein C [Burkholderia sp. Ax-1720]
MTISIAAIIREFTYNGMTLLDPGPAFSPDQVRDLYTAQYPELTTAGVDGPAVKGEVMAYKFVRAAGAKGAHA